MDGAATPQSSVTSAVPSTRLAKRHSNGTTMFGEIGGRMTKELSALAPSTMVDRHLQTPEFLNMKLAESSEACAGIQVWVVREAADERRVRALKAAATGGGIRAR